jgi:hypothetical protein
MSHAPPIVRNNAHPTINLLIQSFFLEQTPICNQLPAHLGSRSDDTGVTRETRWFLCTAHLPCPDDEFHSGKPHHRYDNLSSKLDENPSRFETNRNASVKMWEYGCRVSYVSKSMNWSNLNVPNIKVSSSNKPKISVCWVSICRMSMCRVLICGQCVGSQRDGGISISRGLTSPIPTRPNLSGPSFNMSISKC